MGEPRKEMDGRPAELPGYSSLIEHAVHLTPEILGDDRVNFEQDPLTLGFQLPRLLVVGAMGVIRPAGTLGCRVP